MRPSRPRSWGNTRVNYIGGFPLRQRCDRPTREAPLRPSDFQWYQFSIIPLYFELGLQFSGLLTDTSLAHHFFLMLTLMLLFQFHFRSWPWMLPAEFITLVHISGHLIGA